MDSARIIATGSANDIADVIAHHGAEKFIEVGKHNHYHFAGKLRIQYFANLHKALELPPIKESAQAEHLFLTRFPVVAKLKGDAKRHAPSARDISLAFSGE